MSEYILEVRDLTKHFKAGGKQIVHAVDGVSFSLEKGKTFYTSNAGLQQAFYLGLN